MLLNFLEEIKERLYEAWNIDTTYCPEDYTKNDKSYGQCAVTSLFIHYLIGGELLKGWAINPKHGIRTRHYWNLIEEKDVDFTWQQFPTGTKLIQIQVASVEDLVQNDWMRKRFYTLIKNYFGIFE